MLWQEHIPAACGVNCICHCIFILNHLFISSFFRPTSIMSDFPNLHELLNDPNRLGESLLSLLFSAGHAGLTFQERIFADLNIDDAMNLRLTHRRLNDIVKGHKIYIEHQVPGGLPIHSIENSTLRWLKRRCNGLRLPVGIECPYSDSLRYGGILHDCKGIPPPLDHSIIGGDCCGETCRQCSLGYVNTMVGYVTALSQNAATSTALCMHCTRQAVRRYPYGVHHCICARLRRGHRCYVCYYSIYQQLKDRSIAAMNILKNVHRDRQGRVFHDESRRLLHRVPCPGCGRVHRRSRMQDDVATYCLACNGLDVQATVGRYWMPNDVVRARPTRRSKRLRAMAADEPAIGLKCIVHPL